MSSECLHLRGYLCIFVICSLTIQEALKERFANGVLNSFVNLSTEK